MAYNIAEIGKKVKLLREAASFTQQQLADYLSVDRSAMSNELSKMQREGLLTADKNHFCLKEDIVNSL